MNESGSLQNLNDIVLPGPVPWWPPAPGWYVLAGMVGVALLVQIIRWWLKQRRNRYRNQALAELSAIRREGTGEALQKLPALIKRAALAAWPRQQVAELNGAKWHRFLDESAGMKRFSKGAGSTLDWLAYGTPRNGTPSQADLERLLDAADTWFRTHQRREEKA